jgi:DNA-damage-inducible protein J
MELIMPQSTISARIDSNDKQAFDAFCNNVGLSSSSVINLFIKTVIRENRIPFPIINDAFYSESNVNFLKEGIKALNNGEGVPHDLIEEN